MEKKNFSDIGKVEAFPLLNKKMVLHFLAEKKEGL